MCYAHGTGGLMFPSLAEPGVWTPDPDAPWWKPLPPDGSGTAASPDEVAQKPGLQWLRGGEGEPRSGKEQVLGCWTRPAGAWGPGVWVDFRAAGLAWDRGDELWWPQSEGWVRRPPGGPGADVRSIAPAVVCPPEQPVLDVISGADQIVIGGVVFSKIADGVWLSDPLSGSGPVVHEMARLEANEHCKSTGCLESPHAYGHAPEGLSAPFSEQHDWANHVHLARKVDLVGWWQQYGAQRLPSAPGGACPSIWGVQGEGAGAQVSGFVWNGLGQLLLSLGGHNHIQLSIRDPFATRTVRPD